MFRKVPIVAVVLAVVAMAAPAAAAAKTVTVAKVAAGLGKSGVAAEQRSAAADRRALLDQDCADADLAPTPENVGLVKAAIVCLHNQIRARAGLPLLREHARLQKAAIGHSRDMVTDGYFEHTTPEGSTMVDRILRARYVRPTDGWSLGENLAWGTGTLATARGAVDSWMDSPGHRANILRRAYRELGVGIVLGVPVSDAAGATYTVDFGVRR